MQTLDEALCPYTLVDPTPEELAAWQGLGPEICGRNESLIQEIANNERAHKLIWFYMETTATCTTAETLHAFLLSIFAHGVVVGVSMEKQQEFREEATT